jgi:carboxypeptidase Taq
MFHEALGDVSFERFYQAVNHVEPSLIRTQADEATYNFHIMIRFDIESALIAGDLTTQDVPGAWNEAYTRKLCVTPSHDAEGCLQDIHWSAGLIGYFPTYTLGNLYASQLFDAAHEELGGLDQSFAAGDYRGLLDWLRTRVHRQGMRHRSAALVERVTGTPPSPEPFVNGLRERLSPIYGL